MVKLNKIIALNIISLVLVSILASCASTPPLNLQLPETEKTISLYSNDLSQSLGQTVRWGGIIIETINNKDTSEIIILAYPLDNEARPSIYSHNSARRFIANFNYFIEPNTYTEKREITVIGKLDRIEEGEIGEFNYKYPVILVENHVLWPTRSSYDSDPYYYDDYYRGYGYYPYYYPYYWGYGRHHHYRYYY